MGSDEPTGKKEENLKSENMQKGQFSMFILYFESNQGRQAGVENDSRTLNRGTVNRGTIKRGQLIAGQLIAWTHNRSDD